MLKSAKLEESVADPSTYADNYTHAESHIGSYSEADLHIDLDPASLSDRIAVALVDLPPPPGEKGGFSFRKGDQFDIVDAQEGEDFWTGTHRGKTGEFPAGMVRVQNYFHGCVPIDRDCEVLWKFDAENDDELDLLRGDIVSITLMFDGWCIGRVKTRYGIAENGKTGIFPAVMVALE
mmetsp:Transcript_8616/g.16683  ORF Transcript_8616/g.16683 Transcript_8616/m.16683 type:complete len:178 (+) Transcript_8616:1099-1632(+)